MNIELLDYALKLNCNKRLQITNNHNNVYLYYDHNFYSLEFTTPLSIAQKTFQTIEYLSNYLKMLFSDEVIDNSVNQFIIDYNMSTINNKYFMESVN